MTNNPDRGIQYCDNVCGLGLALILTSVRSIAAVNAAAGRIRCKGRVRKRVSDLCIANAMARIYLPLR